MPNGNKIPNEMLFYFESFEIFLSPNATKAALCRIKFQLLIFLFARDKKNSQNDK